MLKQMKTGLAILFAVLFVISLTAVAADAHAAAWVANAAGAGAAINLGGFMAIPIMATRTEHMEEPHAQQANI
jgi:hypothetical protein